jgi:hypothetical protein
MEILLLLCLFLSAALAFPEAGQRKDEIDAELSELLQAIQSSSTRTHPNEEGVKVFSVSFAFSAENQRTSK